MNIQSPHDFWKGILKNGNGSGSRMFLQVNLKYDTSFYWQNSQHFVKECYIPISQASKQQADKTGRSTFPQASTGRASSTNLDPPSPIWCLRSISWGYKIHVLSVSFMINARALWTYSESLKFPSEIFSPSKITWVTICAINYITHCFLLGLFIIFYSTMQRKTELNSATSPHTFRHLQSVFLISTRKCGTTEP